MVSQVKEADYHGGRPSSEAGEKIREVWGSQAQAWGVRRQHSWGISGMTSPLLLLTHFTLILSGKELWVHLGLILCPLFRLTRAPALQSPECGLFLRFLGPVCPNSASLMSRALVQLVTSSYARLSDDVSGYTYVC